MPNIITIEFRNGPPMHCGQDCYRTTNFTRNCLCRGLNTGVGLDRALNNCRKFKKQIKAQLHKEYPKAISIHVTTALKEEIPGQTYFPGFQTPHP